MTPALQNISDHEIRAEYQRRFSLQNGDFVKNAEEVIEHLRGRIQHRDREQFMILLLNGRNQVIATETLFMGSLTTSAVYPREIVKVVLDHGAAAIVVAHNHPSGNKNPSQDDLVITKKIKEACAVIDVPLHDHIVLTATDHYSFADHDLL